MEQNNRNDRYQEDDNWSSNTSRQQDYGNNFNRSNAKHEYQGDNYSQRYNERNDNRPQMNYDNDWNRNRKRFTGEIDSYRSGQDYDRQFNRGKSYNQGDRSEQDYRNRNHYSDQYSNQYGNRDFKEESDNRNSDRGWWDRTSDEVSSWFGDDNAKRRRRMDEMQQGQHAGKGPKNYKRSPEKIKDDVNERLSQDSHIDATDIDVQVDGTEVTLSGTVDSKEAKRRAEDIPDRVSGITHVQNNLRVSTNAVGNSSSTDSNDTSKSTTNASKNIASSLANSTKANKEHLHN